MKYKKWMIFLTILSLFLLVGCKEKSFEDNNINNPSNDQIGSINDDIENNDIDSISNKIKAMTIEEKIGQLIVVGFEGNSINEEIIGLVEDLKVGGVILFSRNIVDENSVLKLLNDIKKTNSNNDIPLLLSIDEEGGMVSRLPKSFVKLPEAM